MIGLLDGVKIAGGFVAGAAVAGFAAWHLGVASGVEAGRAAERAAALERSMELIRKRFETNAQIDALDDAGLCGELGGKWVPDRQICE